MNSNSAMRSYRFATAAADYDFALQVSFPTTLDAQLVIQRELRDYFSECSEHQLHVLEVGCGTGITSQKILSADERIQLTMLDNEPLMLSQAEAKTFSMKDRRTIVAEDAKAYASGCRRVFDAVIFAFTLHNLSRLYRADLLSAIAGITKTNGLLLLAEKVAVDDDAEHLLHSEWQLRQIDKLARLDRKDLKEIWRAHHCADETPDLILKESELRSALSAAGFKAMRKVYRYYMDAVCRATKQ